MSPVTTLCRICHYTHSRNKYLNWLVKLFFFFWLPLWNNGKGLALKLVFHLQGQSLTSWRSLTTKIILITEKKQSSPKPDKVNGSAPEAQYCFVFWGRWVCFCLNEKPWIIIKKDEIPLPPTQSKTSSCLGLG